MGRIDRSNGQDRVMERRHIDQMLRYIDEYELVKRNEHKLYKKAQEFYGSKGICRQNFLKYYRRYINSGREIKSLLPHKTGRKFRDVIKYQEEVKESLLELRKLAYNRYDIELLLKDRCSIELSASSIYRLMVKLGINRLNPELKELSNRKIFVGARSVTYCSSERQCPSIQT
ncbi:MAG UNVERIFIED_CONTAM: hypothetical protein LVQ98_08040, partial [Rickettsiaceae bacterium]